MGTKVQHKTYFPGHCLMRDLNKDADSGSWPVFHDDKLLMGQYYNNFLLRPATDGRSEYDMESLKRTMLMHEATFRNQVSELHRLYKIQRNMMEELKRKEVHNYPLRGETSQSMYHSSQTPSDDAGKMWDISGKSPCTRPSFSGIDLAQSPSKLNSSSSQGHIISNGSLKDCRLVDSSSPKQRRRFDLQLPADQYIDDEEGEHGEEEKVSTLDNNVNMSLGCGRNLKRQGESSNSDLCFRNKQRLTDLNHPIQGEEARSSAAYSYFLGPVACQSGTRMQDSVQQNSGSLVPKEFLHNAPRGMNNGTANTVTHMENKAVRWSSYNLETGQNRSKLDSISQGLATEEFRTTSKPVQVEFRNTQRPQFLMADQNKTEPWQQTDMCGTGISRSQRLYDESFTRPVFVPDMPSSYPAVPDVIEIGSSFSSWRKPASSLNETAIAVQAQPCSSTSSQLSRSTETSIQKNGFIEAQQYLSSHPRLNSSFGSEISYRNGFLHGSRLESNAMQDRLPPVGFDYFNCKRENASASGHFENPNTMKYLKGSGCMDVKSAKDFNLNMSMQNGLMDGMVSKPETLNIDGDRKNRDPVGGLPWLRVKPACSDVSAKGRGGSNEKGHCLSQTYSQLSTPKIRIEEVLTTSSLHDSSSTSIACNAEDQRSQRSDCPNVKKILGVPIFDRTHISKDFSCLSYSSPQPRDPSEVEAISNGGQVRALGTDWTCDPALLASRQPLSSENVLVAKELFKGLSGVKNHFNLNSCADEEEPSTYSLQRVTVRIDIDLEAPAVPETSEVNSQEEEYQVDQLDISTQSSKVELQDSSEELARVVAEAIITISSSGFRYHAGQLTGYPSETSHGDSLHWFADIVSSHTDPDAFKEIILREEDAGHGGDSSSNGSDYFETMTLKLAEAKVDEYFCKPWLPEPQNEEEACVSSIVPTRRRRGQARRGRQRRDFQRDILPGLASLSRHEVSEDLQVIGGLMRATGHSWQTGVSRRNAGKNGWARGRRRSRNVAPAVVAPIVCSPPRQQNNNSELGIEERSLTGWGKTTRRPRRQRLAAGNVPIPIAQV
ncbi:hypothetical protein IFM89_034422 [Coptis chinensis]|uniref:Uncharacterized protein n=1 Tax=Coptis chinensis TaxID=261450 RepID=A0A835J3K7_9MAGN|nr:hypothetical protein IFM89_034422 [Coptis chinensis]